MSPISSRNSVPPCASSKRPRRSVLAPVKAPRSWPNSSASSRSRGIAAAFSATKGPPARAMAVQRPRHQLLAGAGLARDQHRDLGLGQPADGAKDFLHGGGRGLRHHPALVVLRLVLPGRGLILLRGLLHRALDQRHRLVHIEGLGQVVERAALEGGYRAVQVGKGRHHDHGQAGVAFLQLAQQLQPIAARHAYVRHQRRRDVAPRRPARRPIGKNCGWGCQRAPGPFQEPSGWPGHRRRSIRVSSVCGLHRKDQAELGAPGRDSNSMMPPCCCTKS